MTQYGYRPAGMSEHDAKQTGDILQDRLMSLVDLSLTLKHAHWNVVGPDFMAVHEMFDKQVAEVRGMADEVAERIATLGGIPSGLPGYLVQNRSWDDYALGRAVTQAHLGALDMVYSGVVGAHRNAINATDKTDPVTADLLTAQTGKLEMFQWFIRAHLENTSGELSTAGQKTEIEAAAAAATTNLLG